MSKGLPRYIFRLSPILMQEVDTVIRGRNLFFPRAPWTLSDFCRVALREKLDKMSRSRRSRRRCQTRVLDGTTVSYEAPP